MVCKEYWPDHAGAVCVYLHSLPLIVPCIIQRHGTVIARTAMVTKTNNIANALYREFFLKALEVVHLVLIDHVATLIQVLDWHRTGDKSLSKAPPRNITDTFLTIKDTVIRILKQSESLVDLSNGPSLNNTYGFSSHFNTAMAQLVQLIRHERPRHFYSYMYSIPWLLLTWRCKRLGHQQLSHSCVFSVNLLNKIRPT